ncbi:hypothetical protein, partial [Desulfosarcina sp.]|uniref:hypothetical protein n=1 Tax=Desulfosarcina sp. TaxID=2027861 RepID=UPI00356AA07B
MKRKLLLTLTLLVFLVVATTALILVLRSEAGSRFLLFKALDFSNTPLTVSQCQGSFMHGLTLAEIEYVLDQQRVHVEKAEIDLSLMALIKGELHFRQVELTGLDYRSNGKTDTIVKDMFALLDGGTPRLNVVVGNATMKGVSVRTQDNQQELDEIRLSLSMDKNSLDISYLELEADDWQVNLHSRASSVSPYPFQADIRWALHRAEEKAYRGKWHLQGDADTIRFDHQLYAPWYLRTDGEITLDRISPGHFKLAGSADIDGQHLPPIHLDASGQGSMADFDLEAFQAQTLDGVAAANGHIRMQPHPSWKLTIHATDINPGKLWALWSGRLNAEMDLEGSFVDGNPILRVNGISVSGELLDQPFQASGALGIDGDVASLETFRVRSGNNQWVLNGTLSQNSKLRVDFDVPDPVSLWTGVNGHMAGNWIVTGDPRRPVGTLAVEGTDMRYGEYRLQKVNGTAQVDLGNSSLSGGNFALHEFRVGKQYFSDIALKWDGDFKKHRVSIDVKSPDTAMNLEFAGSCAKDHCEINVDTASFR